MRLHLRITRRTRLPLTLLALLFQQVAFAAYLCSPVGMPAGHTAMAAHCDDMSMVQRSTDVESASALCTPHCSYQTPTAQTAQLPSVPPSVLSAILPVQLSIVSLPVAFTAYARNAVERTPGLPPPLRYRLLLI